VTATWLLYEIGITNQEITSPTPMSSPSPETWREISTHARAIRDSKIPSSWLLKNLTTYSQQSDVTSVPRSCGLLTPLELEITESYTAPALVSAISEKKFTAVEITTAFCKRAAIAQQLVNCLTEIFFDEAIERARYLDKYLEENGKPVGPLHGVCPPLLISQATN
jgi:amidase